ncbi:hypothetical protein D5086_033982 [Populus alba]|uniref:Uncharacterized protein n=1 Tax=Populus alba TaxID=43335 RepID=A0ACC4AE68_POPAL
MLLLLFYTHFFLKGGKPLTSRSFAAIRLRYLPVAENQLPLNFGSSIIGAFIASADCSKHHTFLNERA